MIDNSFKNDSAKTFYELRILGKGDESEFVINMHFTDYLVEALDVRDKWVDRGYGVDVTKITHEKVKL